MIVAILWAVKADRVAMTFLTINMLATFGAAGLMDLGILDRPGVMLTYLAIDLLTAIGLITHAGIPRLIALGYCITAPLYSLNLAFGVEPDTTFTIVFVVAFSQLGIVGFDRFGGGGTRIRLSRGPNSRPDSVAVSRRDH